MNLQWLESVIATHISRARQPRAWRFARLVVGVFVMCVFAAAASALDPSQPLAQLYHSTWNARNGLTGSVAALAQTTDGFLWVGTTEGLFRFDGLYFEQYRPEAGSLPSNYVTALMAVPDGGLWVGFARGGASFLKGARITNYPSDPSLFGAVRSFAQDPTEIGRAHV